jgi:hypothetical protein
LLALFNKPLAEFSGVVSSDGTVIVSLYLPHLRLFEWSITECQPCQDGLLNAIEDRREAKATCSVIIQPDLPPRRIHSPQPSQFRTGSGGEPTFQQRYLGVV